MWNWFGRRLESILNKLIFSLVWAVGVAVWARINTLPGPETFILALSTFAVVLALLVLIQIIVPKQQLRITYDSCRWGEHAGGVYKPRMIRLFANFIINHPIQIARLELKIGERTFVALGFSPIYLQGSETHPALFDIPATIPGGQGTGQLIALAGGQRWSSSDFTLDIPP